MTEYQNTSRGEIGKPASSLKSGQFRAGVAKIKSHVNWAQDFCAIQFGSKEPTFDDLSNEQWVQGFFCILDEKDSKIRENILQYYTPLMQDAIKLNIQTAKRAHAAVLQEIERGRVDWQQLNVLEK